MQYLFVVSIIFIMFLSNTLSVYIGIENTVTFAYTPFVVYFILRHPLWSVNPLTRRMMYVILFAAFAYVFRYFGLGQDYFKNYLMFLVFPMLLAIDLESENIQYREMLKKCLLAFFVIECGLAIYEKITGTYIFYDPTATMTAEHLKYYSPEDWQFRSYALFDHPLMNAMIVSVVMSFILVSHMQIKYKLFLFMLGYTSLWCFNARGATVVASVVMIPFLLMSVYSSRMKNKKWIYAIFALFAIVFIKLLITTSLGGRLFGNAELMDGSAQTRVDVFTFYQYINFFQLLFGSPDLYLFVMQQLHAAGVENGVITMILREGVVFTIFILALLFRVQILQLTNKDKYARLFLLGIFYIVGTMNPALSSALPWTFWMLSYYAFVKESKSYVYNNKKRI